jgi:hypothetical protein
MTTNEASKMLRALLCEKLAERHWPGRADRARTIRALVVAIRHCETSCYVCN